MAVAGVDIGAVATKVAILAEGKVLAFQILPSGYDGNGAARRALRLALEEARLARGDIDFIVSTGYGRKVFSEANKTVTEITAHAEGAKVGLPLRQDHPGHRWPGQQGDQPDRGRPGGELRHERQVRGRHGQVHRGHGQGPARPVSPRWGSLRSRAPTRRG